MSLSKQRLGKYLDKCKNIFKSWKKIKILKKSHDHKNIPIKKSLCVKFLFYIKKICTQGFYDILSGFRVTFF